MSASHDKMIAGHAVRCCYGCCRNTSPAGRKAERRNLKRGERQKWRREVSGEVSGE